MSRRRLVCVFLALGLAATCARAAGAFRYPEGEHGPAQLKYTNGLPVLVVEGTPEEMGKQLAALTSKPAAQLTRYLKDLLKKQHLDLAWPLLVRLSKSMLPQFPPDHLRELEAAAKASGVDRDLLVVANTIFDIKKIAGCSTLVVEAKRSATHGLLFGRNLDFPTLGILQEYNLVTVYRPRGKHAFASVGFPGIIGCASGINDAGLALAANEIFSCKDGSPRFDPKGTPITLCCRRILEECGTVAEAEKLLRTMKRATMVSLTVCDTKSGAVFEVTPKSVVVRRSVDGICACTNHFRTKELATSTRCKRYPVLQQCRTLPRITLSDVAKKLDEVNQGPLTVQTMIFEPARRRLHLSIG
ncbi:MAG TPA: C45 family peptidase, partial [Gemmataceae bacterium]|nr:C45 family peptidase [Gemmataceae bacterium]